MSSGMNRRLALLEGNNTWATLGEVMDSLDGAHLPRPASPALIAALDAITEGKR